MNLLKRILAFAALGCMVFAVGALLVLIVMEKVQERVELYLIPLSAFFAIGLISLAINWLMNLKNDKEKEREAQQQKTE